MYHIFKFLPKLHKKTLSKRSSFFAKITYPMGRLHHFFQMLIERRHPMVGCG